MVEYVVTLSPCSVRMLNADSNIDFKFGLETLFFFLPIVKQSKKYSRSVAGRIKMQN